MEKFILTVVFALFCPAVVFGQIVHYAPVNIGEAMGEYVYSEFAKADGVVVSPPTKGDYWGTGYADFMAGAEFTITSEFSTLTALHIITYDSPSSFPVKVIAVNGGESEVPEEVRQQVTDTKTADGDKVNDIMISLSPKTFRSITFQMTENIGVLQLKVSLLITPEFELKDGGTLYGADRLKLIPKSRYATHYYTLDPPEGEQPNSPEYCKEYPSDGIEINDDGPHTVYAFSAANKLETSLNKLTFNYSSEKPDDVGTTTIATIGTDTPSDELYDLQGRRITHPKPGKIYIQKQGRTTRLFKK